MNARGWNCRHCARKPLAYISLFCFLLCLTYITLLVLSWEKAAQSKCKCNSLQSTLFCRLYNYTPDHWTCSFQYCLDSLGTGEYTAHRLPIVVQRAIHSGYKSFSVLSGTIFLLLWYEVADQTTPWLMCDQGQALNSTLYCMSSPGIEPLAPHSTVSSVLTTTPQRET